MSKYGKKRGITVVAAAVAIAVFSIVAAAGVSLAIKSLKAERNNLINLEVYIHAENALACYRAVGDNDFLDALKATGETYVETDGKIVLEKKPDYTIVIEYTSDSMNFTAKKGEKILLEYAYGGGGNE